MKARNGKRRAPAGASGRGQQGGFTIIEVLASMVIFAIIATGLAASTISVIKANHFSRNAMTATTLAQDLIEQFRALNVPAQAGRIVSGQDQVTGNNAPGSFTREWTVAHPAQFPWGLALVTVTVRWNDPAPQALRMAAYVCTTNWC